MFKVNNKDARTTPSGVLIVNLEHISHPVLVFLLYSFNILQLLAGETDLISGNSKYFGRT